MSATISVILRIFLLLNINWNSISTAERQTNKFVFLEMHYKILSNKVKSFDMTKDRLQKRSSLSAQVIFNADMSNLEAIIKIVLLQADQREMNLYEIKVELCKFLRQNPRRNVLSLFYKRLREVVVNFPEKCPYKKNVPYRVKHFYMDTQLIPIYIPDFNFTILVDLRNGPEKLVEMKVVTTLCKAKNYCQ